MMKNGMITKDVDGYIGRYPEEISWRLARMREIIRSAAPEAQESIAYGMPAYKLYGKPLVYFGGYEGHVGFYATPSGHQAFSEELAHFKQGKGSVQFPHNRPLPEDLIIRMVRFRVAEQSKWKKK
jgi:uncharacterized protein YdhG (YjbR/CyaY superfamily)